MARVGGGTGDLDRDSDSEDADGGSDPYIPSEYEGTPSAESATDTADGGDPGDGTTLQSEDNQPSQIDPDAGADTGGTGVDTGIPGDETEPTPTEQVVEEDVTSDLSGGDAFHRGLQLQRDIAGRREGVEEEDITIDVVRRDGQEFLRPEIRESAGVREQPDQQRATDTDTQLAQSPVGATPDRPRGFMGGDVSPRLAATRRLDAQTETDVTTGDVVRTDSGFRLSTAAQSEEIEQRAAESLGVDARYLDYTPSPPSGARRAIEQADAPEPGTEGIDVGEGLTLDRGVVDAIRQAGAEDEVSEPLRQLARSTDSRTARDGATVRPIRNPLTEDFEETTRRGAGRFTQASIEAASGPVQALAAGFEEPSDAEFQEARREVFPEITSDLEEQLEEETGAELDSEDVRLEFSEEGQVTGTLSKSGESEVAAQRAPLSNVPVAGGVLAQGARYRVGIQQTFRPASEAYKEATPDLEDVGGLLAVGAPAAVAEPSLFGELGVGGAALGIGALAVSAVAVDTALGRPPEGETQTEVPRSDLMIDVAGAEQVGERDTTAQFGEMPAPTESPEEPFPREVPEGAIRDPQEPFPTEQDAPTETPSEPFPGEVPVGETPEQPSDPFPGDAPAPDDPQEPFPEDAPPIDTGVGQTVGGPAAFGTPVGQVVIGSGSELLEEEEETRRTITGEDLARDVPLPGEPGYGRIDRTVEGQRVLTWPGDSVFAEETTPREEFEEVSQRIREEAAQRTAQSPAERAGVLAAQRQNQALAPVSATGVGQGTVQVQVPSLAQTTGQAQATAQVNVPGFGTPPGFGFPDEPGFPSEPIDFITEGLGYGFGTPTTNVRPRPDDDGDGMVDTQTTETTASGGGFGGAIGAGWFSEFVTTLALGPASPRGSPSEDVLEERDEVEAFTSTLPTEAQVSGTEEQQEAIEQAEAFITFGSTDADDDDSVDKLFDFTDDTDGQTTRFF